MSVEGRVDRMNTSTASSRVQLVMTMGDCRGEGLLTMCHNRGDSELVCTIHSLTNSTRTYICRHREGVMSEQGEGERRAGRQSSWRNVRERNLNTFLVHVHGGLVGTRLRQVEKTDRQRA